jgi:hypothetical protein
MSIRIPGQLVAEAVASLIVQYVLAQGISLVGSITITFPAPAELAQATALQRILGAHTLAGLAHGVFNRSTINFGAVF